MLFLNPPKYLFFFVFVFVFFTQCKSKVIEKITDRNLPTYNYKTSDFQIIGHRGYSDVYPENTLLGLEEAFKRGVKYCEIDVNVTTDDVYVLHHDQPTMYRTSSGTGYVVSSTYDELLKLDFGSWKGSQFENTKVATLEEALLLAEKYDAYLYLDTKKFRADLMGKALKTTKVNPKRLLSAMSRLERVEEYKKYCPDSPFVYFGGMPEDVHDDNWYKEIVDLGAEFFETYYTYALDNNEDFKTYVKKVHEHNAKVWVFTSNDIDEIRTIKNNNVDGVESDLSASAFKAIYYDKSMKIAPLQRTTGNWTFEKENLHSTGVGSQLRPLNYSGDNLQNVTFGSPESFNINPIDSLDATIMKVPAFDPENGLFLFTNFTPFKNENLHIDYSLLMDVYIPKESEDKFISLLQTSPTNANDGDLFINQRGIGIQNEYQGELKLETWNRIGIVVNDTIIKKYINGEFVGAQAISGGRWTVYNTFSGGQDQGFLIFADDDNETGTLYVNSLQLRNYAMNADELKELGRPKSNGIAINNSGIYNLKFKNEAKQSVVDWDSEQIYVWFPKETSNKLTVSFDLPHGAESNIKSGETIQLDALNTAIITVTAQDGVTKTDWKIVADIID